jgi:phosphohistidine phosphatase
MKTQSRQLWLLRHAKAEPCQTADFERSLTDKGIKQIGKISQLMTALQAPDVVVSSPALRAKQTTQLLCKQLNLNVDRVFWDERIYDASTSQLIKVLEQISSANIALLTGHNPGLEGLVEYLTEGLPATNTNFAIPTATLVQINMPANWKDLDPGCATLHDVLYSHQKT